MSFRAFVGLVFSLNLLLANVCVMGTAYAATPAGGQEYLSREVPMSFNVVTCTWVKTDDGWQPTPDSPCASGHCLKKEKPDTRCLTAVLLELPAAQLPAIASAPFAHPEPRSVAISSPENPPPYPGHTSTVLRL